MDCKLYNSDATTTTTTTKKDDKVQQSDMDIESFKGTFEVHIIVKVEDQFRLFAYCSHCSWSSYGNNPSNCKHKTTIRPTCALAHSGDFPCQPMLTYLCDGTSEQAVEDAKATAKAMEQYGLHVLRTKVELVSIPKSWHDQILERPMYWETHFAVASNGMDTWRAIEKECANVGAALFFNPYSKKPGYMTPVVTLRRYDTTLSDTLSLTHKLRKSLTEAGFECDSKTHVEMSVFDDNVQLDNNWLFVDTIVDRFDVPLTPKF